MLPSDTHIRLAMVADAASIAAWFEAMGCELLPLGWDASIAVDRPALVERVIDIIRDPDSLALIAEEKGAAIGYMIAGLRGNVAEVISLYIEPGKRHGNVPTLMYHNVESWARGRGARQIVADVLMDNRRPLALLARQGFTAQPLVRMHKEL